MSNFHHEKTTGQSTTNSFADALVLSSKDKLSASFYIEETGGVNGIDYRILGSLDGGDTYNAVVTSDTNLAAGGDTTVTVRDYFTHFKVQVKAAVADSQGTVTVQGATFDG